MDARQRPFISKRRLYENIKLLLAAGADVHVKVEVQGKVYTALSSAKKKGHTRIVALLKKYGAKE